MENRPVYFFAGTDICYKNTADKFLLSGYATKKDRWIMKRNKDKKNNNETLQAIVQFSQIGVTMTASVLLGVLLGKYLDGLFGTSPWLLLIFSFLGAGAAIKLIFNMSKNKK